MRNTITQTILDNVTPVAVTSSTDATPIVVTATAHGFTTGDRVMIYGHTTNVAANGIRRVTVLSSSTFSLQDEFTGADIAGSGAGAGSAGIALTAPTVVLIKDFHKVVLQISTSGTATTNIRTVGSLGRPFNATNNVSPRYDFPNIGATVTVNNPYDFLQLLKLTDLSSVDGGTGIVIAGTDINSLYEVNINAMKYLTVFPATWSAGAITIKILAEV
jgi:hypothetical protein